ncbi:plexin-B isoform X3 [Culicoides brevitarsis]|uniref:plexin-B isoform X3 n=1 Tax=Culicoides brevitarsis TaxID=469753 RepID=UPI00307C505B
MSFLVSCIIIVFITATSNFVSPNPQTAKSSNNSDIVAQYTLTNNTFFSHLAYDYRRNVLYVGATNRIFQMHQQSLQIVKEFITGPKIDSPSCHASGCSSVDDIDAVETNNYNKILVIDHVGDSLIACGSVHQGACEVFSLAKFPDASTYISRAVAANDENSTTFAFIGPSRYTAWKKEDVLYVGATFTNVGDYRHDVPAIASRKLDDLEFASYSFQESLVNIDVKYRDHFLVNYVYGFNASDYAYFLMVQKKSHLAEEAGYVTRLARLCVNDPNYDSYTEITLSCIDEERKDFNILRDAKITVAGQKLAQQMGVKRDDMVLVAVFSPSREITNEPQNSTAMCVYTLKDIDEAFSENIHLCFNGTIKDRNLGYISGPIMDGKCPSTGSTGNIYNFCNAGLKISGVSPLVADSLFTWRNESITSVTVTQAGPHTLAFLGTSDGWIKKVLLSGPLPGEYEKILVDEGNAILPDTLLSPKQDSLYVLSTKSITKMLIQHCNIYTNCTSCLESRDPFCGWCSLEKRCTVRSACHRDQSASRWLSLSTGQQCIDFEMTLPDRIPISQQTTVQLIIRTLPELPQNAKYRCVFGNSDPIDANVTDNGLMCQTPPLIRRPMIEPGKDHVSVPLSVRSSETNKDFVSRNFSFYDCSRHDSCRSCVQSQWGCNWCIYDNKCVHNVTMCRNTGSVISDESYCPHFKHNAAPILLPNKVAKEIRLEVENLPRPQNAHSGFLCNVEIEGAKMILPARVENNKFVVCERTPYSYETAASESEARVEVHWNRNHFIDSTSITLYKCDILGSHREHADCSLCVTRDKKYQCTWCNNQCVYNESCIHGSANECPRPRIDMIKPLSGPIEGGTLITIEGSNLGIREEDVRGKIRVGDVPCELVNYEISVKIECRTGPVSREMTASVKVGNEAGYTESSVQFQYKDIKLEGLYPTMGPKSGGTKLSIIGKFLNIGSNIKAFLDHYVCEINVTQASNSRLTCVTSGSESPEKIRTLTLMIDGANRTFSCSPNPYVYSDCSIYNYTVDPKIHQIKPLKSFIGGGRMITVHGSNLDSIQKPEIEVLIDDVAVNKSTCFVINPNQMECPSPPVNAKFYEYVNDKNKMKNRGNTVPTDAYTTLDYSTSSMTSGLTTNVEVAALKMREKQLGFQISFIMDNVKSVKDLNKHFENLRSTLVYVEDPVYYSFDDSEKSYKGDTLVIEGENLNVASDESDVNVTIGMMPCNVTSLALSQLVCTPPKEQPEATDENGVVQSTGLPLVVVRVGRSLRYPIGHLRYDLNKTLTSTQAVFVFVVVASLAIVVILTIVLILYRRKSTQAEREYRRIQIQMDTLESNVRMECKQAFAELQTDMTDLAADIENSGIPTLDHVNYIMKVFFPGVTDHPILNTPKIRMNAPRTNYDQAMLQFEQLINNKYFLLSFIETLEQQKTFNIRDKVNVASLLMIVLMNKMEYATDILQALLLRLIDKSVTSKHPQLMLRRTESVVEKMLTNYMAICMYDYLKEYAGSSLFLLFKAIKHQIEKGLVDVITHDARYSLSEERLLREQIEHSYVTLHILQDDLDEKIQCRVLDVDSISQVKAKILDALFKNTPFSMRPAVQDVDLEWRHGRGGHLTLQDEDLTTKTINGWKRLNTLAHYGVKESAVMSLIAKQNEAYAYNNKQIYPNCYYISNTSSQLIINGDMDPAHLNTMAHQMRIYHLVRPHTDEHHHHFRSSAMGSSTERTHKAIPEIFLTRLLATKGTIQKFVDDFFATILTANDELPPSVKWLFDLLDDAARRYGITDPDVVHAWKSNSLPLRFWVNFIKNPDFIFDINKTTTVDASLSVIAQTFMDACSTTEHRLGKDSPSNKLLFAKDIPQYREMVARFYAEIQQQPQISDQEMCTAMNQLSMRQNEEFDTMVALKELYIYVTKYRDQILDQLDMDHNCKKMHLSHKLENVACTLEGTDM